jgi:hypothetical protein
LVVAGIIAGILLAADQLGSPERRAGKGIRLTETIKSVDEYVYTYSFWARFGVAFPDAGTRRESSLRRLLAGLPSVTTGHALTYAVDYVRRASATRWTRVLQ